MTPATSTCVICASAGLSTVKKKNKITLTWRDPADEEEEEEEEEDSASKDDPNAAGEVE